MWLLHQWFQLQELLIPILKTSQKPSARAVTQSRDGVQLGLRLIVLAKRISVKRTVMMNFPVALIKAARVPMEGNTQSFEQPNPTPSCDSDESVDLPADVFTSGIYDKFCDSFQEGKQQRRTPPTNTGSYSNYQKTLQFDVTGSMPCFMACADAFKSTAQSPCGRAGSQQNVMSKEASIDINCGTLSYVIRDKDESEYATLDVGEQKCFPADKWGDFLKMPSKDDSSWDRYFLHNFYGNNDQQQFHFDATWIPGCQLNDQTEQDLTDPLGSDSDAHCGTLFKNTHFDCMDGDAKNGGAGGWIDVGCVRYLFKPTNTRD
ncbi:hypothetical protein N8T08_004635 [Aspergillus melleus]|uniref:Uncharacterized protein n=1 Tax=Aspergillus melleus TaxID=138277 RepID=A0ACC3B401_9EURO|nr:hypothetical protein N8T08_004635 [Aspergillus melleus]